MKYLLIIFLIFPLVLYAQQNEEVKIIERSFSNGIDWTCNVLNNNNAFGGNLKSVSSSNSKDKRIISNSYVEIVIVAKNGLVNSVAITPKNSIVYNKIIRQLGSWNKNGSTYYIYGYKCSVISSSKEPYFLFFKEESSSSSFVKEQTNSKTPDAKEATKLIKRMGINDAEILLNVIEITLLDFWKVDVFINLIGNSPYLGFPVLKEDACRKIDYGYMACYGSSLVRVYFSFLEKNKRVISVMIAFYDDRLYDRTMIDVHKKYKYKNGIYEREGFKCELSKFRDKNILKFSRL